MRFFRIIKLAPLILILFFFTSCNCSREDENPNPTTPIPSLETEPAEKAPKTAIGFLKEDGFRSLAFNVDGGLVLSIKNVLPESEPYAENIAAQIIKALLWDMDHRRDIRKGDSCKVLYKPTRDRFKIRVYGIEYTSQKFEKTYSYFFFWERERKFPEFYTEAGTGVAKRLKNCPLRDYDEIVSLFRIGSKNNTGIKFRVQRGTEVYMPYPAVVLRMNWDLENEGLSLEVRYPGTGKVARFSHLSAISDKIEPGVTVSVGTVFARTGVSGKTQVPHLEYSLLKETEEGPKAMDPFEFHGQEAYLLDMRGHRDFVSVKHQIMARLEKVKFPVK